MRVCVLHRRPLRGASLGGTLLAVAFVAILAFSLSSLSVNHLRMNNRLERGSEASNAARSTVSAAISKVLQDPSFGRTRSGDHVVRVNLTNATGVLSFHIDTARDENLSYSTNNLEAGTDDTPGVDGAVVPAGTAHLIGVGRSGGVERRIEAVLRVPAFPWAIASGGRIATRNGVYVAALPEGVWPPPTDESQYLPADLVANGLGSKAIALGNNSTIFGDVEAVGDVHMESPSSVVVKGEVRSGSSPIELPTLRVGDYDPVSAGLDHFPLTEGNLPELTGVARADRSLKFAKPLKLDNGQLFVDGDIHLEAGVSGSGLLIATGDITVEGGAQVEAPTELAVLAGRNVKLQGEGTDRSRIRGLFYAGQSLEASELTLVGTLVTGQASTGIALDEVNVLHEEAPPTPVSPPIPGKLGATDGTVYAGRFNSSNRTVVLQPDTVLHRRPDYPYAFSLKATPKNAYPCQLTVTLGPGLGGSRTFTIRSAKEFKTPREWLQGVLTSQARVTTPGRSSFAEAYGDANVEAFENQTPESTPNPSPAPPTLTIPGLFADLSKFIPLVDRIRLVSWIES